MPKVEEVFPYDGAVERIERLGLRALMDEVCRILTGFELRVMEQKDANGGAVVRKMIDARFAATGGWAKQQTGDVDWVKCQGINGTKVCIAVEIQVSGRSDSGLFADIAHLRKALNEGRIDVGIIVVPTDRLGSFLTDRVAKMSDAKRHVATSRAEDLPLILIAIEHDGPGPAIAKQRKRASN